MHPINVYFEDSEMETLKKVKGNTTWHDVILEYMKQTEVGEINPFALRALCMEYDLEKKGSHYREYQGYSLLQFFLKRCKLPFLDMDEKEWQKRLTELRSTMEGKKE